MPTVDGQPQAPFDTVDHLRARDEPSGGDDAPAEVAVTEERQAHECFGWHGRDEDVHTRLVSLLRSPDEDQRAHDREHHRARDVRPVLAKRA